MFKSIAVAVALILAPLAVSAMPISGTIDINGGVLVGSSEFTPTGSVVFATVPGAEVFIATGDFDTFVDNGDAVTLTNIDFTSPDTIWSVGGFTFTASVFTNIAERAFTALGIVSGNGFDDTQGLIQLTTQDGNGVVSFSSTTVVPLPAAGLLLISAFGGLVFMRRRQQSV